MIRLLILGAGGFAREAYFYALEQYLARDVGFFDDTGAHAEGLVLKGERRPVFGGPSPELAGARFVVGVGSPAAKRILVAKALALGLSPAPTIVHTRAHGDDYTAGVGGVICPGVMITTNVRIGDYAILNLNCTVGHDAVVGDYATANPGCHISGNVTLGAGVLLGTGTSIREKIRIASDVVTGAQACVVKDLLEPGTYTGVPARRLEK